MALDANGFRKVMGSLAAGVTVVTMLDRDGRPWGLTATAVCSVSLEPPLILVCVDRQADCYEAFLKAEAFTVNLLREDQQWLSHQFSRKTIDKFEGVLHRQGNNEAPILADVLGYVECRMHAQYPGGDHTIFLGEAVGFSVTPSEDAGSPLLHFRGSYARVGSPLPSDDS